MARIYLDARALTDEPTGVGRYIRNLVPALVERRPDHEWVLVRHRSNREPLVGGGQEPPSVYLRSSSYHVTNVAFGSLALADVFDVHGAPDIYHNLFHLSPRGLHLAAQSPFDVVVTLHDLIWLDHPESARSTWWEAAATRMFGQWAIPPTLRGADHVICVSEPTASRAAEWLDATPHSVIGHGVEEDFFASPDSPGAARDDWPFGDAPYVVAVGNDKAYKNLRRLVGAFPRIRRRVGDVKLVLIGSCEGLRPAVESLGLESDVWIPGFVGDRELRALVGGAEVFAFPSLVEGFGLPILEAMALEVPTVVSDLEPMRSVAGDAARRVDPRDTEAMAAGIAELLAHPDRAASLADRGRRRAEQFRWERTAEQTWQVYDELLDDRRGEAAWHE